MCQLPYEFPITEDSEIWQWQPSYKEEYFNWWALDLPEYADRPSYTQYELNNNSFPLFFHS